MTQPDEEPIGDVQLAGRVPLHAGRLLGTLEGVKVVDMALYHLNAWLGRRCPAGGLARAAAGGRQAVIPLDDINLRRFVLTGHWEKDVERFAAAVLLPGDTVVDVGANIGLHTLYFATAVVPGGRVFAFEPGPWQRALLERSVALTGAAAAQTVVIARAVGAAPGSATLHEARGAGLTSSLRRSDIHEGGSTVDVQVTTLDAELLQALTSCPRLLKIDVEGLECEVLRGAQELLARYPPDYLILEFSWLTDNEELLNLATAAGYRPVELRRGRIVPRSLAAADLARRGVTYDYTNVFFRHDRP